MSDNFAALLDAHVRERVKRAQTELDEAVWAMLQAGAHIEDLIIDVYPYGRGDDPTPFSVVRYKAQVR